MKFRCTVCDYIYDESLGDALGGVKPNTKFSDLPDDWVCPVCFVSKEFFEEVRLE